MYPIKTSFGKKCPTITITTADSSTGSATSSKERETTKKQTSVTKDKSKYILKEEEKEKVYNGMSYISGLMGI